MDERTIIQGLARIVARTGTIHNWPSEEELRKVMCQFGAFSEEKLQEYQKFSLERFCEYRTEFLKEQLDEQKVQHLASQTPSLPTPSRSINSRISAASERSNHETGSQSSAGLARSRYGGGSQSVLDEPDWSPGGMLSIHVNGEWHGAGMERSKEDRSFVSTRIVQRHNLQMVDDEHILLTWKIDAAGVTHRTRFFLNKRIRSDFQLGEKCCDEASNREEVGHSANKGKKRARSAIDPPPPPAAGVQRAQEWVNNMSPDTEFLSALIVGTEKRYRFSNESPLAPHLYQSSHHSTTGDDNISIASSSRAGFDPGGHRSNSRGPNL